MKKFDPHHLFLFFISLGVGYLAVSLVLFSLFAPLETIIMGFKVSFISLVNPVKISSALILIGLFIRYFWIKPGIYNLGKRIRVAFNLKTIQTFLKIKVREFDLILLIILLTAAFFRYWGINFGLPNKNCRPDEEGIIGIALNFFNGDYNPHFFKYPTLYMYMLFGLYQVYFLMNKLIGRYASLIDLWIEFTNDPSNFFLIDRFLSALLGTATIFIVYKLTKSLLDRKTALISSLFLGLTYLHVRDSHFGVTDVSMTFFIMVSALFIIKSYQDKTLKHYILSGVFAGMAASIKYGGVFLFIPIFIVHILNILEKKENKSKIFFDQRIILFLLAVLITFLLGTPYALLDFPHFIGDFLAEMAHFRAGNNIILGTGWWYHLSFSLFFGLGWSLFFVSLAGIVLFIIMAPKKGAILSSFPVAYYCLISQDYNVFVRYSIPLIPFLCITGAVFTVAISNKVNHYLKPNLKNITTSFLTVIIIWPSFYTSLQFDKLMAKEDNRLIATEWINQNLPEGRSIFQSGSFYDNIELNPPLKLLEIKYPEKISEQDRRTLWKSKIDYLRRMRLKSYEEYGYDDSRQKFYFINIQEKKLPDYLIIKKSLLIAYSQIPEGLTKLCNRWYRLKKSFEVINTERKENVFDQQDAFFIPYAGFKDIQRPGPNIYIYEKIGLDKID